MRAVIVALSLAISSEGIRSAKYVEGHSSDNISDPSTGPSIQVSYGQPVSATAWKNKRDFVVNIGGCTGAVSGDMVLTAAHCINRLNLKTVSTAYKTGIKIIKTWVHPAGWDVGIVQLESPQTTHLRMRLSATPLREGQSVRLTGFGKTEKGTSGKLHDTGNLRIVKCSGPVESHVVCAGSGADSKVGTCGGDSGAPWFIESKGTFYIVGVNFGGSGGGGCGSYTKTSGIARADKFESWVKSITSRFKWESHR